WVKSSVGYCVRIGYGIDVDKDNNIYITGLFSGDSIRFDSAIIGNSGAFGTDDAFVAKLDSMGTGIWVKRIGNGAGSGGEEGTSISVDNEGNVVVTGIAPGP